MKLRIRDLREDHDLTQQRVAEILMCDQSLYSKYERGERSLPLELAVKLADIKAKEELKKDRAKTQVEGFTKLDLMEMTRKHICSHKE